MGARVCHRRLFELSVGFIAVLAVVVGCSTPKQSAPSADSSSVPTATVTDGVTVELPETVGVDEQAPVKVTALAPNAYYYVAQCVASSQPITSLLSRCDVSKSRIVQAEESGQLNTDIRLHGAILLAVDGGRREFDCLESSCVVAVGEADNGPALVTTEAIQWDGSQATPRPTLQATNATTGESRDTFEVTGSGFMPGERVSLVQCPVAIDFVETSACRYDGPAYQVRATSFGSVTLRATAVRYLRGSGGKRIDCARQRCGFAFLPGDKTSSRMSWAGFGFPA